MSKSKLSCKKNDTVRSEEYDVSQLRERKKSALNTSPIAQRTVTKDDIEEEYSSPFCMRFTQDSGDDDLDVIWDWDSPRSKRNTNLCRKRILHSSPKIVKKLPSVNNIPRFNSLKAELEVLVNKLHDEATQDTENHSSESEATESTFNQFLFESQDIFQKPATPVTSGENDELFDDDSLNGEMIKCSQQVEEAYNLNKWCNSIINNNRGYKTSENKIEDDSFDMFLEEIKDEEIEKLSQASSSSAICSQPTIVTKPSVPVSSPRLISRTNSVPTNLLKKPLCTITKSSLISKTKSDETGKLERIHCSPEEIEKKRQEAKTKLEFKRKQHEIEKNRLEALKRLKKNQMQKMLSQNTNLGKSFKR